MPPARSATRQHRHPERQLDADADRARQRQHRHRRRPGLSDTSTINITAVNDAPVATITPTSYAATEQTALTLKNTGLSISGRGCRLRLHERDAGRHRGHADCDRRHAAVRSSPTRGTSSVTITGTVAQINDLLSTNATSTVSYIDNTDTPSAVLDADADGARQRQHRHRRRPGLDRDLDHQHHGRQRRSGGDDHADELCGDRADGAHLKNTGLSIIGRRCRLRLHERDAGRHRGHADVDRRHQRRIGLRQRHLVGDHHRHGGADQRPAEHQCHQHGQLRRQHRYAERRPRR